MASLCALSRVCFPPPAKELILRVPAFPCCPEEATGQHPQVWAGFLGKTQLQLRVCVCEKRCAWLTLRS